MLRIDSSLASGALDLLHFAGCSPSLRVDVSSAGDLIQLATFVKSFHMLTTFTYRYIAKKDFQYCHTVPLHKLLSLIPYFDGILILKLGPVPYTKICKHKNKNLEGKRSAAKCENIIRGLVLTNLSERCNTGDFSKKQYSNKFTNFQRNDRGAGAQMEAAFSIKHGVFADTPPSIISEKCSSYIVIFDEYGCVEHISGIVLGRKPIFFYQSPGHLYLIRNMLAFSR